VEKAKFAALLPVIIGGLASKIIDTKNFSEAEAIDKLYMSALYTMLENEKTKVWHYSIPKLYELWENETETGQLVLPEY
jgi:hypothetical protein